MKPDFVEFLRTGWSFGYGLAIDFTGSNGEPNHRESLHYINKVTDYEKIMSILGSVF